MPGTRRKRSAAWRYFKLVDGRAVCQINHCQTELMWHGSTTALNAHLQSRHSDMMRIHLDQPIMSAETPSCSSNQSSPVNSYPPAIPPSENRVVGGSSDGASISSLNHQEIDQRISDWVAAGPRHACAVEEKTFQDLIQFLVPGYKVPSAMVIAGMINSKYFTAKSNLQRNLLNAAETSKISLSISLVSSFQNCLVLSAYFITNVWTMNSQILACIRGEAIPQTGDAVAKWINDKLQDFALPSASVAAVVHSSESWITCGVNMLADAFGWHSLLCCESVLRFVPENLAQDQQISIALGKVNQIVQFFTESEIGKNLLQRAKERSGFNFVAVGSSVAQSLKVDGSLENQPNIELIQILVKVLQPLDAALLYLKKNDFVPSSATPILLSGLEKKLLSEMNATAAVIKEECSSSNQITLTLNDLESRLKRKFLDLLRNMTVFSSNDITTKAAALDPRYKKLFFINSDERQAVYSMISAECFFIHKNDPQEEEESQIHVPKMPQLESSRSTSSSSIMDDIMKLGSGCHDDEEHQHSSQEHLLNRIKKEMDVYFGEKPPPSDVDPLGWWRVNQSRFPMLARLARSYLCIPASANSSKIDLHLVVGGICNHVPLCKQERIMIPKSST